MDSTDRPSSNAAGAAAVRQPEHPSAEPDETQPPAEERAARIAELQEQYRRGSYHVEPEKVSTEIVNKHLKK